MTGNLFCRACDIIVHLAGPAHSKIPENAYSEFDQVNWLATQRLADAAKEAGIERFVYISSVRAQIGASAVETVHEQDEPRPTNQYGRSKLAGEQAVRASDVPFTIFRPVVIYGPHPKGNMGTMFNSRGRLFRFRSCALIGGHCLESIISFLRLSSR